MPLVVRRLEPEDDRSTFESGDIELDRFFQRYAGQNQFRHHLGVTYVALDEGQIVGFATIAPSQIEVEDLPSATRRSLPKYPLPVLRLARLAVAKLAQGRGAGLALLRWVFSLARQLSKDFGCVGIVVDAKPGAVAFYQRFRFEPIRLARGELGERPAPQAMFLELGAIPKELEDS